MYSILKSILVGSSPSFKKRIDGKTSKYIATKREDNTNLSFNLNVKNFLIINSGRINKDKLWMNIETKKKNMERLDLSSIIE